MSYERLLAWGNKVSEAFRERVLVMGTRLAVDPSWLMACMHFETGGTFSPTIKNPVSGYLGLVQFGTPAARDLDTTLDQLEILTAEQQLEYVERYFLLQIKRYGPLRTFSDVYMAILYPKAIGTPENHVLFGAGTKAYLQNRGLDIDHDNAVTKAEAASFPLKRLTEGLQPENATLLPDAPIEDRSTEADDATRAAATIPQEKALMADKKEPSFLDAALPIVSTIATAINPIAGALITAFSPWAREKIANLVNKHTDNPVVGQQVADAALAAAVAITQKQDPLEAVIAARSDPAVLAKVEADAMNRIEKLLPLFDRLMEHDKWRAKASDDSANQAAARVPAYGRALATMIAKFALSESGIIVVGLLVAMGVELTLRGEINAALLTLAGPLLTLAMRDKSNVVRSVFGSQAESDATTTMRNAVEQKK